MFLGYSKMFLYFAEVLQYTYTKRHCDLNTAADTVYQTSQMDQLF